MTLMEFSIVPMDKGPRFSKHVAGILDIVDRSGLDYRLNPMGTVVEGQWDELIGLIDNCFKSLESQSDRISLQVKFDHRKGVTGAIEAKIESVKAISDRAIKT